MDVMNLVEALQGRRLIAHIPVGLPDWLGACEVLLQERVRAWAFSTTDADRAVEAMAMFGRRARVGIHGARTPQAVADAAARGVHFLTSPVASAALLAAADDTPIALGALTPNEVQQALDAGASTVQVVPADGMGMAYGRALVALFPDATLLAAGRFERYQCDMWLDAGAAFVALDAGILFGDRPDPDAEPDLEVLRRRAQEFGDIA